MKGSALLLVVLGLILGPGYYLYCEHLSGREAVAVELKERADRWQLADGSILRFRSGQAYRPVPLDLHPERNRVRLRLSFEIQMPAAEPSSRSYEYQASLFDLDQPLVQRTISVQTKPNGMRSIVVATVAVHTPAEHLFVLEEIGKPPLPPARVVLRVRESVEQPFMPLVWVGAGMLLGGIGFALVRARRSTQPLPGAMRYTARGSPRRLAQLHAFPGWCGVTIAALLASLLVAPAAVQADAPALAGAGQPSKVEKAAPGRSAKSVKTDKAKRVRGANKLAALGKRSPYTPPPNEDEALTALERDVSLKVGKQSQVEDYPAEARRWRWTGTALVDVLVAGNGIVKQVVLSRTSGFRVLDEQALVMVRRVQKVFVPIRLRGRDRTVTVPVGFYLQDT